MAFICTKEAFVVSSLRVLMASISQHLGLHGYTHIDGLLLSSTRSTLGTRSFYKHLPNHLSEFHCSKATGQMVVWKKSWGNQRRKNVIVWWLYGEYMGISLTHEGSPSHHGSLNPKMVTTGDLQIMDCRCLNQTNGYGYGSNLLSKDLPSGYD
jgi:hypothetical protein